MQLPTVSLDLSLVQTYHNSPKELVELIRSQAQVDSLVFDATTKAGRDAIRTHSAALIKCIKPAIDKSKELAESAKKIVAQDLSFRKTFEAGVREIAENFRQPLTEYEAEQERIKKEYEAEQERQQAYQQMLIDWELAIAMDREFDALSAQREAEKKLALEQEERQRLEKEAQQKAHQEMLIEKARQEAVAKAERDAQLAAQKLENERIARERNEQHRKSVHDGIFNALVSNGISEETAIKVVNLAIEKQLANLIIQY